MSEQQLEDYLKSLVDKYGGSYQRNQQSPAYTRTGLRYHCDECAKVVRFPNLQQGADCADVIDFRDRLDKEVSE